MTETNHQIDGEESARLLKLATYASVTTAIILIVAKLAAYIVTNSVSVLASLIDSLLDAAASIINLFAVRYALEPPDNEHRFGHGKAESIAGLAQSMFIAGSGVFLIIESIERLAKPAPINELGLGLAVMVFAIAATLVLLAIQHYVIRRTQSVAIKADSLHYKTDLLTNTAIILALVLSQLGWYGMDPLFALGVAIYILYSAWKIAREAFNDLLDRELPEEKRQEIIRIATDHPQVMGAHDLRTRVSGRTVYIQLHLELDDQMRLLESHRIADNREAALRKAIPGADIVIHQDPAGIVERRIDDTIETTDTN
ncbi:MAG: cation diffusion facilitator family transporter [Halieaceae bacterium]